MRSMRVLKSFRVLRIVKMFRYMDSLQQIAKVLITSINSFAAIVVLLGLFWLVFSIVGLHVFGGLDLAPPGWPNCDSLINSAILNFHVRDTAAWPWGRDDSASTVHHQRLRTVGGVHGNCMCCTKAGGTRPTNLPCACRSPTDAESGELRGGNVYDHPRKQLRRCSLLHCLDRAGCAADCLAQH